MGLLTAGMKAEVAKPNPAVALGLEIGSGSTMVRAAKAGLNSTSRGRYDFTVRRWGKFTRALSDRSNALQDYTAEIEIDDTDRSFLAVANRIYRQPAVVKLLPMQQAGLTSSDIHNLFTGIVTGFEQRHGQWILKLGQNKAWLEGSWPKATITPYDWPNAPADSWGLYAPIVVGRHDANVGGLGQLGMVNAIPVKADASPFWWLVSLGYTDDVPRVYADGVGVTGGGVDYTLTTILRGGRYWTILDFNAAANKVTFDVDGIEANGDGTGAYFSNPADQLRMMLVQFVSGDWGKGPWLADATANIDTTYFTASKDFFASFGYQGSRRFGLEEMTGLELLNEFCEAFEAMSLWTNQGKLAVLPWDHRIQNNGVYPLLSDSSAGIDLDADALSDVRMVYDDESYTARYSVEHIYRELDQKFLSNLEVRDTRLAKAALQALRARWLPAFSTTTSVGLPRDALSRRINRYRKNVVGNLEVTLPLKALDWELTTDLAVAWRRGFNEDGTVGWGQKNWQRRLFRLRRVSVDGDALNCEVELENAQDSQTTFWSTYHTKRSALANPQDGVAFLGVGSTPTFARNTQKFVDDPVDGRIVGVLADLVACDAWREADISARGGLSIEAERTNAIASEAAIPANWTLFGTGVNGSAIAQNTAVRLYDAAEVNAGATRFLAGNPHAAALGAVITTSSITANNLVTVSIDHQDDPVATELAYWRMTRAVDGWFWNEGGRTWQAGSVDNSMPRSTTWLRYIAKGINVGASNTTLNLALMMQTGGTASRVLWFGHAQDEVGRYASTRIKSATVVTRPKDNLQWPNDGGQSKRLIPAARGAVYVACAAQWAFADLTAGQERYLFKLPWDSNNHFALYYAQAQQAFVFDVRQGGTTRSAISPQLAVARGQHIIVRPRWGSAGDRDYANAFHDVAWSIDDGVTWSVSAAQTYTNPATEAAAATLYVGQDAAAANQWDGNIYWIRQTPFCVGEGRGYPLDAL